MRGFKNQYNLVAVSLHWIMAISLFVLFFVGSQILEHMPNSHPEKISSLRGHAILGSVMGALLVLRYLNIKFSGKPSQTITNGKLKDALAKWTHSLLYLLLAAVVGTGIAMAVEADFLKLFAGTIAMPESFDHLSTRQAHGIFTKMLAVVICIHILAALHHQFILKDNLFRHMRFKRFR